MIMFLFAVFDCKGTEKFADMQVMVCEMVISLASRINVIVKLLITLQQQFYSS